MMKREDIIRKIESENNNRRKHNDVSDIIKDLLIGDNFINQTRYKEIPPNMYCNQYTLVDTIAGLEIPLRRYWGSLLESKGNESMVSKHPLLEFDIDRLEKCVNHYLEYRKDAEEFITFFWCIGIYPNEE